MVSTTAGGRPLKSAMSRPGATHGGSIDLDAGAIWCRAPERGGPSSEECAREVLSRGKASSSSLSLHSVCASRLTGGNAYLRKAVRTAVCQCVCAEGALGQREVQLAVGGLGGSKQVYLSLPESTPDQTDRLGMDLPLSGERELS